MMTHAVTIIGAGIVGLTAALALQRAGLEVRVHEQSERITEVGAGLHISPDAYKILRAI